MFWFTLIVSIRLALYIISIRPQSYFPIRSASFPACDFVHLMSPSTCTEDASSNRKLSCLFYRLFFSPKTLVLWFQFPVVRPSLIRELNLYTAFQVYRRHLSADLENGQGYGYIRARNNTTQQSGQTPDKEVEIKNITVYVSGYTETGIDNIPFVSDSV